MLTTAIRQRVRDNCNRDDVGIDAKLQDYINDTKRRIEQRYNMDYMKSVSLTTHTNAAPAQTLPARLKAVFLVQYRKTLPSAEEEMSYTEIPVLSEAEVLRVEGFLSAGVIVTGAPLGYTMEQTTITVHPTPAVPDTYQLKLGAWTYSADWTFGGGEEPYLAAYAWQAVINGATALAFAMLGEAQDAGKWDQDFEKALKEFTGGEHARALEGELSLRPHSGAAEKRPSAWIGWQV